MAIDRVILSSPVPPEYLCLSCFTSMKNVDDHPILKGGCWCRIGLFHLTYLPRLDGGTLFIDFNLSCLIAGDNIHSVWSLNLQDLWEKVYTALLPVARLVSGDRDGGIKHLRYWKVSYYEFNFDLIMDADHIQSYYEALTKMKLPRLDRFDEYDPLGSIYNLSNETLKDSNIIERAYLKLPERLNHLKDKMPDYYQLPDLVKLLPGQEILRIETAHYRPKTRYDFKEGKDIPHYKELPLGLFQYNPSTDFPGSFQDIMSYEFQEYSFNRIVGKYHLDKTITTRTKLYRTINTSAMFTTRTASTAKKVIRYLNGDTDTPPCSRKQINHYKRLILDAGYHYITSEVELPPVTLESIMDSLTDGQKELINQYRSSDLIRDNLKQLRLRD
jgi:hypothetical protein